MEEAVATRSKVAPVWLTILTGVATGAIFGLFMALAFEALGLVLHFLAAHDILWHKTARFKYDNLTWYELWFAIGSVAAVFMTGSLLRDQWRIEGWGMFSMAAWFWPKSKKQDDTIAVRLGRVLHWITIGIAVCSLLIGVAITYTSYDNSVRSANEFYAWQQRHPTPVTVNQAADAFTDYSSDPAPYKSEFEWTPLWLCAAFGFLIALAGRGLRYIIAGE